MNEHKQYDVIIIGGSYAGLAAGMTLGRALKSVLIIDDEKPCNRQTPHSHNFLTNDGKTPAEISGVAKSQLEKYKTIKFATGTAVSASKNGDTFSVLLESGQTYFSRKLVFATGIKDLLPKIDGLAECWGISVLHCPFCHGYEVKNKKTGIIGNGDQIFEFAILISNWTKDLVIFTNGPSQFSDLQKNILRQHHIQVVEKKLSRFLHINGHLNTVVFSDNSTSALSIVYSPAPFEQHCKIPEQLGCELTENGYIKIDNNYETTVEGVYSVGDNASKMRTVANAVAMGTGAGIVISKKIIAEQF